MEVLTSYLKEVAFDPMRARAILNMPESLSAENRLSAEHASALMSGDMGRINSIIASETNGVHGKFELQKTLTTVIAVTDGIEPLR